MINKRKIVRGVMWAGFFCLAMLQSQSDAIASEPVTDTASARVKTAIWFDGNSTIHPFTCTASTVVDTLVGPAVSGKTEILQALLSKQFTAYTAVIPVKDIHSHESDMDKNMYKALKPEKYPEIRFVMSSYELAEPNAKGERSVKVKGHLTLAGKEKPITLEGVLLSTAAGFRISGSYELLMKDYGIDPPSIMFVINVDNKVVVHFDVSVN